MIHGRHPGPSFSTTGASFLWGVRPRQGPTPAPTRWNRTFYVAANGNDNNDGRTPSTPWQTLAKVATGTYGAGDSINFRGGDSFNTASGLSLTPANWLTISPPSKTSPVVIQSYGTGNATLHCMSGSGQVLTFTDIGGFTVQNLNLTGVADTGGIGLYNDTGTTVFSDITFQNLDMSSLANCFDIETYINITKGFDSVTIKNINIHNLIGTGNVVIYCQGTETAAYAFSNFVIDGVTADLSGAFWGFDLRSINGLTVQNCFITNGGGGNAGIETQVSTNILIQNNEVSKMTSTGTDGDGIDIDLGSSNVIVRYNYVHECAGAGIALFQGGAGTIAYANVSVYENITVNNGRGTSNVPCEICLGAFGQLAMSGIKIYNNTFYSNAVATNASIVRFEAASVTGFFANNILYGSSSPWLIYAAAFNPSTMLFTGNTYFGGSATNKFKWNNITYATMAAWQTATTQEKITGVNVGLTADPKLYSPGTLGTSNYRLLVASACLGGGINLLSQYGVAQNPTDYFGNTQSGYNVGAYGSVGV